ncbi:MAG TPA: O-antigen ligase family protein [Vicinamibacteria bacterium]|nr:O-antigen ligase family protein [Vicinamibacteria bacterium]
MVGPAAVARAFQPGAATGAEVPPRAAAAHETPPAAVAALYTLLGFAVLSPWALGGVTPAGSRALAAISLGIALVVGLLQASRGAVWLPRVPLWPVGVLLGLGLCHLMPLPVRLHELVAPGSAAVWHPQEPAAAALLGTGSRPISIHPAMTRAWLGLAGGLCALVVLAIPALGGHTRTVRVAWILVGAGTLVAVYGVVARAVFGPLLYGSIAVPTVAPFGPFVNKNHFAGYVEMPALLALGLARGLSRQTAGAPGAPARPAALVAFGAAAAMMLAVLLSMSRGGALGLAGGIAAFAVLEAVTSRRQRPGRKVLVPIALVLLLTLVVALIPAEVQERLFNLRWRDDSAAVFRLAVWKDALRAWMASPVVGLGLGAFADALPRFKSSAGLFAVEHPENEAIEIAVEGGLVALVAAAAGLAFALLRAVRTIKGHHDRVLRGIVTGAVAGAAALLVHGLVDFNLRIPSNAAMFLALVAVAVGPVGAVAWRGHARWVLVVPVALCGLLYSQASPAWPVLRAARASAARAHATGGTVPAALRLSMADRRVREYLALRPADPEGWLLAAWLAAAGGRPADAAGLARHAVALDPQRPGVVEAARAIGLR